MGNFIKAKIGYLFFIPYVNHASSGADNVVFRMQDIEYSAKKDGILKDINIAENFLYGGYFKFPHKRYILPVEDLQHKDYIFSDTHIMITDFFDANVMGVSLNTCAQVPSVDALVYLRQIMLSGIGVTVDGKSITQLINSVLEPLGRSVSRAENAYLVEINDFFAQTVLDNIFEENKFAIYGMLTGDEGYEYVAPEIVDTRLKNNWSTREFVRAIIFRNNFMLFNLNKVGAIEQYQEHQAKFGNEYYGAPNPYFFTDASTAGVNHGILFSVEVGMVAKTITSSVLDRQAASNQLPRRNVGAEIKKGKELRRDLILTLNRLEDIGMAEMSELDRLIVDDLDVEPLVEKIKYLLELLESELDLLYQTSTNRLVNILTVAGLLLSAFQIILAFIV